MHVWQRLVRRHGLRCKVRAVSGAGHRNVVRDIGSGQMWMTRKPLSKSD